MAIPLLDTVEIKGKVITTDALLTQREFANYLVLERRAHYHFTVKGNQPTLLADIELYFQNRGEPDSILNDPPDHGRIETRKIWVTTELNDYLNFPHVGQAFVIERLSIDKKTGKYSVDVSPANPPNKPMHKAFLPPTGVIGALRTAVTTSLTGTTMRTGAASASAMARKTSPASEDSLLE